MDSELARSKYVPPTPNELRAILKALNLTGAATGKLLDVSDRTVRRWTSGERELSFASLYTLLHRTIGRSIGIEWRSDAGDLRHWPDLC